MVSRTRSTDYTVTVKEEEELQENTNRRKRQRRQKSESITDDEAIFMVTFKDVTHFTPSGTTLNVRKHISPKDLPPECLRGFRTTFKPAVIDLCGTLGPWQSLGDDDIVRLWDGCFPKHPLRNSSVLHTIVTKLVDDTLKRWRQDIASAAVASLNTTLKTSFDHQPERIDRATWLLGDDDKDRKRPFYYKTYEDGAAPSGIFQSPLIAETLATHLTSISGLASESRLQEYPTGALALSILAVKRALTWAKTGVDVIPRSSEGHFSRANWGNHHRLEGGRYVLVKTSNNIVQVINKLRNEQWEKILTEAEEFAIRKNPSFALRALLEREPRDQSDFELEDADEELSRGRDV